MNNPHPDARCPNCGATKLCVAWEACSPFCAAVIYASKQNQINQTTMNIDLNDTTPDKDRQEPKPEELTCFDCELRKTCEFVDDPYNTDGDCLASK